MHTNPDRLLREISNLISTRPDLEVMLISGKNNITLSTDLDASMTAQERLDRINALTELAQETRMAVIVRSVTNALWRTDPPTLFVKEARLDLNPDGAVLLTAAESRNFAEGNFERESAPGNILYVEAEEIMPEIEALGNTPYDDRTPRTPA